LVFLFATGLINLAGTIAEVSAVITVFNILSNTTIYSIEALENRHVADVDLPDGVATIATKAANAVWMWIFGYLQPWYGKHILSLYER
jgi:hypothetical protein